MESDYYKEYLENKKKCKKIHKLLKDKKKQKAMVIFQNIQDQINSSRDNKEKDWGELLIEDIIEIKQDEWQKQ